jgi:hypothetical protein
MTVMGVVGHVFIGPIVHWAHGHSGKGFASLGINVGAPFAGALLGMGIGAGFQAAVDDDSDVGWGALGGIVVGTCVGWVTATVLDTTLLSTEQVDAPSLEAQIAVVPMVDANRFGLSLIGRF